MTHRLPRSQPLVQQKKVPGNTRTTGKTCRLVTVPPVRASFRPPHAQTTRDRHGHNKVHDSNTACTYADAGRTLLRHERAAERPTRSRHQRPLSQTGTADLACWRSAACYSTAASAPARHRRRHRHQYYHVHASSSRRVRRCQRSRRQQDAHHWHCCSYPTSHHRHCCCQQRRKGRPRQRHQLPKEGQR